MIEYVTDQSVEFGKLENTLTPNTIEQYERLHHVTVYFGFLAFIKFAIY
jgi:hypothetical protein